MKAIPWTPGPSDAGKGGEVARPFDEGACLVVVAHVPVPRREASADRHPQPPGEKGRMARNPRKREERND